MGGIWIGFVFFFKQKTAYEVVSRDWSSDVCSSDLAGYFSVSPLGPASVRRMAMKCGPDQGPPKSAASSAENPKRG